MNIASITIIILRILLYLFKNLPGPAQGCELELLRFTAVTSKQVRSESQTRNPHKQIVTHTHRYIYIYWGVPSTGFLFKLHVWATKTLHFDVLSMPTGQVFPRLRSGFSTRPAGFFHAYGRVFPRLRPGFSVAPGRVFPRPGRVVHGVSLAAQSQSGNTGPICGKSCGKTQAVCGQICGQIWF